MKLFIVATYNAMIKPIEILKNKHNKNIHIDYGIAILEEGLKLALEAKKKGYDAIISRGGTARLIKKNIDIPVIDAKPSGNDLLKSILIAKNNEFKTSIIAYSNITDGAVEIIKLLNLDFNVHYITNDMDISSLLIKLKEEGYEQILGDSLAVRIAADLNFHTILFQTSYETLENSVEYAIMMLNQIRKINEIDIIRSKFLPSLIDDYIIMANNKIIFSHLSSFDKIPISFEKCISLKYDLDNKSFISSKLITKIEDIEVNVSSTNISEDNYYLYTFKKIESNNKLPNGFYDYGKNNNFISVTKSKAMMKLFAKSKKVIDGKKPIFVIKDNEYTLNELLNNMININNYNTLLVKFNEVNINDFKEIIKYNDKNILLENVKDFEIINYISENINTNIIVLLDKNSELLDYIDPAQTLIIPKTEERKEDIITIFNNYIAYYHEKFGTSALQIQESLFKEFKFLLNENLDSLLKILKYCIFNENEIFITNDMFIKNIKADDDVDFYLNKSLEDIEKEVILSQLKKQEYNQTKVSEVLGISRSTLWRKMKKFNL